MSIAVLDKTFSTLEVLARAKRPLRLTELASESRLPKPTVYRILRSLRDLGYVEQDDRGGSYRLSERLISLREYGRDAVLREKAAPLMQRLHDRFDETINLAVLEGMYVRYAHVVETSQPLRWIVKPGARDSFHTTALGRAIVAAFPTQQRERLVAKACQPAPQHSRATLRRHLEAELSTTAALGYALDEEETAAGVACVAVALSGVGEPLAAVSLSVPINRFSAGRKAEIIEAMLGAPAAERVAEL